MKNVTKYFRNILSSTLQETIELKNKKFATVTREELQNGKIDSRRILELWPDALQMEDNKNRKEFEKNVIIALKTVKTKYLEGQLVYDNLNEMMSLLLLPAKVNQNGMLSKSDDRYAWIPREYLSPMIEPQLSIGRAEDVDTFFENTTDKRCNLHSWQTYFEYARELYEFVTKSSFDEENITNLKIETDGKFYLFEDGSVNSVRNILRVYDHLLDDTEPMLYSRITSGRIEPSRVIRNKLEKQAMIDHAGQMGGEYPLSPSQREAVACFDEIGEGEVLAVNGPPGTGKTTLLQSIVADLFVKAALAEADAPVIIATSTNNQAVTNIIDSFGQINPIGIKNLEHRWVTGVNSFAVYFPSQGKVQEAQKKGYQFTDVSGRGFAEDVESKDNRRDARKRFEEEFLCFFGIKEDSVDEYKNRVHSELKKVNAQRITCIDYLGKIFNVVGDQTISSYMQKLSLEMERLEMLVQKARETVAYFRENGEALKLRCLEWQKSYAGLPWYVRWFKFIPYFKRRIVNWTCLQMREEELSFLSYEMNIDEIVNAFCKKIEKNNVSLKKSKKELQNAQGDWSKVIEKKQYFGGLCEEMQRCFAVFSEYDIRIESNCFSVGIAELNNLLDKVRYLEFWLAVHYYEALWLNEELSLTENQKHKTFEKVLNTRYRRLAMITPCMVMTCHMLPKQFYAYDSNEKTHFFMYDYADLLIVDEAGQISPEVGCAAFAFAKRVIVVGDEMQIPPVWGVPRVIDITMAISNGVISCKAEFEKLEENGLNCSQSSLMRIASRACPYEKYGKGLFLSEHRRCYNEIIQYCNDLVYKGKLEPLRGGAYEDANNVLVGYLPPMGYKQIETATSQRIGTSRCNEVEAKEIVEWLNTNYSLLVEKYKNSASKKDEIDDGTIVGVITPFKAQSNLIKQILKKQMPELEKTIAVGTVHTFQGAERKVIIFSSVYGNTEGCFFINNNASLMNVAVSRAKDSFLIFGDIGCLIGDSSTAGGKLRIATKQEIN